MASKTDHDRIVETLYRFAQGIDTRDWQLLESVFTDPFEYDYTSHRPASAGVIQPGEWVDQRRRRFQTMTATQHTMTNPRVQIAGDTARCRMYVEAWHLAEIDGTSHFCTIGGEYHDDLLRRGDQWLIAKLRLERRWTVGNPLVLDLPTT
jgi:SnoaL-like domain